MTNIYAGSELGKIRSVLIAEPLIIFFSIFLRRATSGHVEIACNNTKPNYLMNYFT